MHLPSLPRLAAAGLLAWFASAAAPPAAAHAVVVASVPAADAVVHGSGLTVELRFNSRIDRERSRLMLVPAEGPAVMLPLRADGAAELMEARIEKLPPGAYRLRWQVLGVDGHITRGDIPFRVAP